MNDPMPPMRFMTTTVVTLDERVLGAWNFEKVEKLREVLQVTGGEKLRVADTSFGGGSLDTRSLRPGGVLFFKTFNTRHLADHPGFPGDKADETCWYPCELSITFEGVDQSEAAKRVAAALKEMK